MQHGRSAGAAIAVGVAVLLALSLAGCSQTRQALGLTKQAPDEFQVVARAPLSLPPDYNLRPPAPGAPRPQEGTASDQAKTAVFGYQAGGALGDAPAGSSQGEAALLQSAGATGIDPNIRLLVDQETSSLIEQDKKFIDDLIFWRDPEPPGEVIDPVAEQQRLQENAALGNPVTEGETPIIERRERGLLEGIF
jgi:hypothetical protein